MATRSGYRPVEKEFLCGQRDGEKETETEKDKERERERERERRREGGADK